MRKTLIIPGTLLVAILLVLGACTTSDELTSEPTTGQESYLIVISTRTESILVAQERDPFSHTIIETEYFLDDPQKLFLTVTFWVKPATVNRTINIEDIVLVSGASDRFYPVGLRTKESPWDIFTSGTIQLKFPSENQNQVELIYDSQYDSTNSYGLKNNRYEGSTEHSGSMLVTFTTGDTALILAYVVSSESISSSHFQLELPDSQPVELEVN